MARIRTIKPEFPQSESMGRVSREARLLFIQLWTVADDFGRLRGNSRMLASLLYPYDDDAPKLIDAWIDELVGEECVAVYEMDGNTYMQILKWEQHQRVDKPTQSRLPEYSREFARCRESSSRTKDLGPRILDRSLSSAEAPDRPDEILQVFEHWRSVMGHQHAKLDDDRRKRIRNSLKAGYTPALLCRAIDGCKVTPHNMGKNDRNGVYDGLSVILKSADQIDRFIGNANRPAGTAAVNAEEAERKESTAAFLEYRRRLYGNVIDGEFQQTVETCP